MTKIQPEFFFYVSVISHVSQTRVEQRWALRARADKNKSILPCRSTQGAAGCG